MPISNNSENLPGKRIGNQPPSRETTRLNLPLWLGRVRSIYAGGARAGTCRTAERTMNSMYWVFGPSCSGTRTQLQTSAAEGAMTRWHREQASYEELAWWCQTIPNAEASNSTARAIGIATRHVRFLSAILRCTSMTFYSLRLSVVRNAYSWTISFTASLLPNEAPPSMRQFPHSSPFRFRIGRKLSAFKLQRGVSTA